MKIIIDAMGGDNAPQAIVQGALDAHKLHGADIILVGRMEEYSIVTNTTNASASPMSVIREQAACRLSAVTSNARIALEFVE